MSEHQTPPVDETDPHVIRTVMREAITIEQQVGTACLATAEIELQLDVLSRAFSARPEVELALDYIRARVDVVNDLLDALIDPDTGRAGVSANG